MRLFVLFWIGLSWLANAASIPPLRANVTAIESRDVSDVNGFRSVAYFVNWVSSTKDYLSRLSIVP